jgi:NADH-quinone oxidoreductase subunit N
MPELTLSIGIISLLIFTIFIYLCNSKQKLLTILDYEVISLSTTLVIGFSFVWSSWLCFYFNWENPSVNILNFERLIITFVEFILTLFLYNLTLYNNSIWRLPEYWIILLELFLGFLILIANVDLATIYLSLELIALSFYLLASAELNRRSLEAALKYFTLSAVSSSMFLLSCLLIYYFSGHLDLINFSYFLNTLDLKNSWIIFTILFASLFFKFTAAPFHNWAVDVYQGVSYSVLLLFMTLPKLGLGCLLINILIMFSYYFDNFTSLIVQNTFLFSSAISFVVGTIGALQAQTIKKFLAYTTITHIGFIMLSFAGLGKTGYEEIAAFVYLFIYSLLVFMFFILLFNFLFIENKFPVYVKELQGLYYKSPLTAIYFSFILFSMAGIPPFIGFMSKYFILYQAFKNNLFFVAFLGILTSVISCFYYIRIIRLMLFNTSINLETLNITIINKFWSLFLICFNVINVLGLFSFSYIVDSSLYFFLFNRFIF